MPVGCDHCGLQVVGHHDGGHAPEMLQAQAQGEEEVLRALRRHAPCEDVVAEGHASHEDLRLDHFACLGVYVRQLVPGEVHHQLLACLVGRGQHGGDVLLRHEVLPEVLVELRLAVAVGMRPPVLLPQQLACDVQLAVGELLTEVGQQAQELLHALVRIGRASRMEHTLQDRVVCLQQVLYLPSVGIDGLHVAVYGPLVDW